MHLKVCMDEHFDLITNPFKYKCETYIFMSKHYDECKIQLMNNGFNTFNSCHMLIVQKM